VNALFAVFGAVKNVITIASIILLIFAIIGVSVFKGTFYECQGLGELLRESDQIVTKQDCLDNGGTWENQIQNFDNVSNAFFTLFIMMTTDGWQDVMNNGIDHVDVDMQPKRGHSGLSIYYFFFYIVIGSLFVMNLFVGVVIDNFN
jgi:hypothetical protein